MIKFVIFFQSLHIKAQVIYVSFFQIRGKLITIIKLDVLDINLNSTSFFKNIAYLFIPELLVSVSSFFFVLTKLIVFKVLLILLWWVSWESNCFKESLLNKPYKVGMLNSYNRKKEVQTEININSLNKLKEMWYWYMMVL